jgi:hypothetical protein
MFEVELLVLLLWRWDVNAMLFDVVVVVLPSVLNWFLLRGGGFCFTF